MKKHKALQLFNDDYLEQCKLLTAEQILTFLEEFRELMGAVESANNSDAATLRSRSNKLFTTERTEITENL